MSHSFWPVGSTQHGVLGGGPSYRFHMLIHISLLLGAADGEIEGMSV